MLRLARISIARPRLALAAWGALVLALSVVGLGVADSLSPSVVVVAGSESSRAEALANAHFGPAQLVPILLEGPPGEVARQGPALVRALRARPHTRVLSAWDAAGASDGLRPAAGKAMIVVSVQRTERQVIAVDQPRIERLVARYVRRPVRASVTGQASIDRALRDQALSTSLRSELIALGILFVLLLIALRAPLAAALVTLLGAATVLATDGLMALLGHVLDIDPIAVTLASMTGLALGVGYSLLILDRVHSLQDWTGAHAALSALAAVRTTGRSVLIAGTGLLVALLTATAIAPTTNLASLGIGVLLSAALAIGSAVVVMPAALSLLAGRGVKAAVGAPAAIAARWDRLLAGGDRVRRGAPLAGGLACIVLLGLAVPALSLRSGPPGVSQLPAGSPARRSFEEVARVMGPGWPTPYDVIVVNPRGPVTTAALLAKLDRFQEGIARGRRVASVTGPGGLSTETKPLGTLHAQLGESRKLLVGGRGDLKKLLDGLGQAGGGAKQLQGGLSSAAAGAGQLRVGSGSAGSGSAELHAGLAAARAGSAQLSAGLEKALAGAQALKRGATSALAGSIELADGIGSAHVPVAAELPSLTQLANLTSTTSTALGSLQGEAHGAAGDLASALSALRGMSSGRSDPGYAAALSAVEHADGSLLSLEGGLTAAIPNAGTATRIAGNASTQGSFLARALSELHTGAAKLQAGLGKLRRGNVELAAGIGALSGGGAQLTDGLTRLREGAGALETGLQQIGSGAGELEQGLAGGVSPVGRLVSGLGVMQSSVAKFRDSLPSPKGLEELQQKSPGLFDSGYFLLAAIAGAPPAAANAAEFVVNVARGGNAAQVVVVSRYSSDSTQTAALDDRLRSDSRSFAARNGLQAAVGGPAGNLTDFASVTGGRLPLVIIAVALAIALGLGLALRAVALPLAAVLIDLLTAAATFGALALLFGGSHPLLGGPGYLDPMSVIGIFAAIFGVSLIFLLVLLDQARREFVRGAGADRALEIALRRTAASSTGAGLLMIAAATPFASTNLLTVRQFGVAFAVAIALDAFLVRPVLLPAAVEVLGDRAWWPTRPRFQPSRPRLGGGDLQNGTAPAEPIKERIT
jgi:RND superfamily putative drug exporter